MTIDINDPYRYPSGQLHIAPVRHLLLQRIERITGRVPHELESTSNGYRMAWHFERANPGRIERARFIMGFMRIAIEREYADCVNEFRVDDCGSILLRQWYATPEPSE